MTWEGNTHGTPVVTKSREAETLAFIGELIYKVRWGLIPMYVGLWIGIIAYNVEFFWKIIQFLIEPHHSQEDFLMWILALIDITMIGNLVVMTTVGGYSTFVREYKFLDVDDRPRWMNGLDSSTLKIKMSMSLVGVSAIHLLKTFMESSSASWDTVGKEIAIHALFLVTTLVFTWNARLMHPSNPDKNHAEAHH